MSQPTSFALISATPTTCTSAPTSESSTPLTAATPGSPTASDSRASQCSICMSSRQRALCASALTVVEHGKYRHSSKLTNQSAPAFGQERFSFRPSLPPTVVVDCKTLAHGDHQAVP